MIRIKIDIAGNMEVFDRDFHGNSVYPEKSKTTNICVTNELDTPDGGLAFTTVVKVDKREASSREHAISFSRGWLLEELPRILTASNHYNFFASRWLQPPATFTGLPATDPYVPLDPIQLELPNAMAECVQDAIAHIASIKRPFDAARSMLNDFAYNNTAFGFKQSWVEASELLSKTERVLSCSGEFGGSSPDHVRGAQRDFEELANRQIESNRNYQHSLRNLQRFASALSFPRLWARKPEAF